MSGLAERRRVRSEKRPSYNVDGSEDEDEVLTYQRRRRKTKDDKKHDDSMRDDSNLTKGSREKEEKHLKKMTRDESLRTRSEKNPSDAANDSDDEDDVPIGRRRKRAKQDPKKIMRDDPSLTTTSMGERLRVRPEKRPSYNVDEPDDEDEAFIVQRRRTQSLTMSSVGERLHVRPEKRPSYKVDESDDEDEAFIVQRTQNSTASSLVETLRVRSRPSYNIDESDDEDEVPLAQRRGHQKEEKPPVKMLLKDVNLSPGTKPEGLHTKSEKRSSYNDTDKSDDEDEVPIGHLRDRLKGDKPLEKITRNDLSKVSSFGGRHCVRTARRPLYKEDDPDDEDEFSDGPRRGRPKEEKPPEKITRDDMKEDACQACGESGRLIGCGTCTYVFHRTCVLPPRRATFDDSWSCPECVSPLNEIEKILDIEMHPVSGKTDASKQDQKQNCVRQYLVKWKGLSYLHCTWVAEDEFIKAFTAYPRLKSKLSNFKAKMESANSSEDDFIAIRPEWTTVDRVIDRRKNGEECEYFVKWKELGYDECSWEVESDISAFQPQIENFHMIQSRGRKKSSCKNKSVNQGAEDSKDKPKEFHHYEQTPEFLSGTLHPYQLEGLNFLRYSWSKKTHVILADEMGLGKTIQSIAFLTSLSKQNLYPHLVVAPLSTLRNWEREFSTWAPEMNVVMYFGSTAARAIARQYEFFYPKEETKKQKRKKSSLNVHKSKQRRIKFDVLLTSYEMINLDSTSLKNIQWECLIVDEGHRLKNKDSKLFLQLKLYATKQRVLLTGTPLQNNLDELFMLMHFLDNGKFRSIEEFQKEFTDINQEEQIERLHKMLAPHLLRRLKKDVMKDLPPKKELILRVELSNKQKEYYKAILTRNYQVLARRSGAQISLNNVVMELRKLCGHAYMLEGVEPVQQPSDANEGLSQLLESSGKMQLLDKMMVKLKEEGHRVLVYSQFQHMLDLLEDYLSYKKWSYERIDGKVSGAERQIRIDRFNANNSTRFCFLLSTRAGGLGINLASADTVIIYDSDWNPHADLQAMARAHRLGQINKVMIYRLITRGTIEERMMQLTKKKMILEHLVVGRLKAQKTVNQEELDDIIRYGSKELFADENDEAGKARQIHYDAAAIERLLSRDQIVGEEPSIGDEDDDFLKAFKVANFEYIDEVEAAAAEELAKKHLMTDKASCANSDKANYWDDLLRDKYEVHQVEALNALGKGKRSRKQLATSVDNDPSGAQDASSEDEYRSYDDYLSESETSSSGDSSGNRVRRKKARADHLESLPLMEGEGKSLRILGFNQYQRNVFLQTLMRFGFGDYDWKEFVPRLNGKTFEEIHEYGFLFMRHIDEGINGSQAFSDGVPKEGLRVEDVFVRLAQIRLIKEKVKFLNENPGASLFPEDIKECYPSLIGKYWRERNDIMLLKAVLKHGYGKWQAIVDDKELGLVDVIYQELSLPSSSELLAGGVPINGAPSFNHSVNGFSDSGKGSQSHTNCSTPYQYREVERRIVDFIRKRYQLLEKLLDLELCLDEDEKANACDTPNHDPNIEQTKTGLSSSVPLDTNPLLRELPDLEAIAPPEELPFAYQVERLSMAQLYNGMCEAVESDSLVAIEACLGDSRANYRLRKNMDQLEPFCEDVLVILARGSESLDSEVIKENHVNLKASSGSPVEVNGHISDSSVLNGHAKDAIVVEEITEKAADLDE